MSIIVHGHVVYRFEGFNRANETAMLSAGQERDQDYSQVLMRVGGVRETYMEIG